jgi:hypothetical protein
MYNVTIPKPCHQNWDAMELNEQGRHCLSCAKTVVDFTGMSDAAVKNYFINHAGENTCGRFKNSQLQTLELQLPENIFNIEMPLWKQFLAASLLAFSMMLFSCNANTTGKAEIVGITICKPIKTDSIKLKPITKSPSVNPPIKNEVIYVEGVTVGDIQIPIVEIKQPEILMGTPSIVVEEVKIDSIKMNSVVDSVKVDFKKDSISCEGIKYY